MSHQVSYVEEDPRDPDLVEDDSWDQEWLAQPKRRSRSRRLLLVALAASLVFWAGVEVEQRWGSSGGVGSAADQQPGGGAGGLPGEMPSGSPGQGGASDDQSGEGAPSGNQSGQAAPQGGSEDSAGSTQVIGTVVAKHGSVWVVKDLGGTKHRIKVTDDTSVVEEKKVDSSAVKTGSTVDITVNADDSATADSVTVR
ncbi:MAG: hypothetical protein QM714_18740 [Nocardioides sp.]|uniref:hypothetical protein n=1 Tax=Nocardioides sp. TaxID=35761 RepID=UPI0039E4DF72